MFPNNLGFHKYPQMPKFPTFPTLYDKCQTISVSELKRWGYLEPEQLRSGTITRSRRGRQTGPITVTMDMQDSAPYLELDYECDGKPVNYQIQMVSVPSNIGKGIVWYFLCPNTLKRCRKLYLGQTYFYHREAIDRGVYEKQTYSHRGLKYNKAVEGLLGFTKAYKQIFSKYFKTQYDGKPTRRFQKLLQKMEIASSISENDVLRYL
jgi:hypothetical protein